MMPGTVLSERASTTMVDHVQIRIAKSGDVEVLAHFNWEMAKASG